MRKWFLLSVLFTISILTFTNCSNNSGNKSIDDGHKLTRTSSCVIHADDVVVIDINGYEAIDSFDAHEIISVNYAGNDPLKIKLKSDADIVKAEKTIYYYPTIWSGTNDKVMQFVYLFNLGCKDVMSLKIDDGIMDYPVSNNIVDSKCRDFFESITKDQMLASIDSIPEAYNHKKTSLIYESYSWQSESKVWKRIANRYIVGELTDEANEPFDVDPYEIMLVVTFCKGDSTFTKTFCDEAVVGN